MGALPAGKSVGRKALMTQTEGAGPIGVGKLTIKAGQLRSLQQPFVDHRAAGKRRNIKRSRIFDSRISCFGFRALAYHIELALESVFIQARRTADEKLLDIRLRSSRYAPNRRRIRGHVPPAYNG